MAVVDEGELELHEEHDIRGFVQVKVVEKYRNFWVHFGCQRIRINQFMVSFQELC